MGNQRHSLHASISFLPLQHKHFPLLHAWLARPHVAQWWGEGRQWRLEDVAQKYESYVEGYKVIEGVKKPIHPFIITFEATPIGYIQFYNAYDFPRDEGLFLKSLPESLASFDLYIGECAFIGKGLAPVVIEKFLEEHVWNYFNACFVDVDIKNTRALRAYEKAGFQRVKPASIRVVWMVKTRRK